MTHWVIVCSEEERKKMKTFKRREILSVQEDENGVCIEERFDPSEDKEYDLSFNKIKPYYMRG